MKKIFSYLLLLAAIGIAIPLLLKAQASRSSFVRVIDIFDGDTIKVTYQGKPEKVRLIGVDAPELRHSTRSVMYYAQEAADFTERMVKGKRVRLEFDENNKYIQNRDKYDRLLAYVYLEDGFFLNAELLKRGYGFAYTEFPFKYQDEFRRYQKEAAEGGVGLWGKHKKKR